MNTTQTSVAVSSIPNAAKYVEPNSRASSPLRNKTLSRQEAEARRAANRAARLAAQPSKGSGGGSADKRGSKDKKGKK
jgi:hypothetical protein